LGRHLAKYYLATLCQPKYFFRAIGYWVKYISSLFQWLWWGYGERPARIFGISILTIFGGAGIYYLFGGFKTQGDLPTSIYFSIVTFTTLGYGDVVQTGAVRFVACLEAFIGAMNMAMLVAALSQKTRY